MIFVMLGQNVSIDLNALYHSKRTLLGKECSREYHTSRTGRAKEETELQYDGIFIEHDDDGDYYDLVNRQGDFLCCDGETCTVRNIHNIFTKGIQLDNNGMTFTLSDEEFNIATNNRYNDGQTLNDNQKWGLYMDYLSQWIKDHADPLYCGMSPCGYNEYIDNEYEETC